MTPSIAVVIPTRHRADLATRAIRALLTIPEARMKVIVSNNSDAPEDVSALADFCARAEDARLLHLRPPRPLPMAEHWDWALEDAMARSDATHFAMHYDRRISRPELRRLLDVIAQYPDDVVTYLIDAVYPTPPHYGLYQMTWSGELYAIRTARALELASRAVLPSLWGAFPVLVNAVVPRAVLERVRSRFGSICVSTTPESCFGFRFAALHERYLHDDMPLAIHYAFERSNGLGYLRGDLSGSFGDFLKLRGDRPWLEAAPIPGLNLGQNVFYHEYSLVQRARGIDHLPPIDMEGYVNDLASSLKHVADPVKREEMRDILVRHGWQPREEAREPPPRRVGLADRVRQKVASALGRRPPQPAMIFKTEEDALAEAQKYGRARVDENDFLAPLEPVRA